MNKSLLSGLLLLVLGCAQVSKTWETDLYPDNNNIPWSVVSLPGGEGYLILGQRFTMTDSVQHVCALVKLSHEGEVLKEVFFGQDKSRLVNIATDEKTITLLAGSKKSRLWIRQVDHNLNILSDKVFDTIDVFDLYQPKILFAGNDLIVVLNSTSASVKVIRMTRSYDIVWQNEFVNSFCKDAGSTSMLFKDAFLKGNSILITGNGHPFQQHEGGFHYDSFFIQLNAATGDQQWFQTYGDGTGNFSSNAIKAMGNKYYAVGTGLVDNRYPDVYLYCLSEKGKLHWVKPMGGSETEWGNDLAVYDQQIKIVGFTYSNDGIFSENNGANDFFVATVNDRGEVLDTKVFGSSERDELNVILNLDGEYSLLLGNSNFKNAAAGNAWKIMKIKNH